jgi:hypothetical protein
MHTLRLSSTLMARFPSTLPKLVHPVINEPRPSQIDLGHTRTYSWEGIIRVVLRLYIYTCGFIVFTSAISHTPYNTGVFLLLTMQDSPLWASMILYLNNFEVRILRAIEGHFNMAIRSVFSPLLHTSHCHCFPFPVSNPKLLIFPLYRLLTHVCSCTLALGSAEIFLSLQMASMSIHLCQTFY